MSFFPPPDPILDPRSPVGKRPRVQRGQLTNGQAVRTRLPSISIDETGLTSLVEEWACDSRNLIVRCPKIDQPHPEFTDLVCKRVSPEFGHAGIGRWRAEYRGLILDYSTGGSLPPEQLSVESVAGMEDIRAHPDWASLETLAGDDIVFDDDRLFIEFRGPAQLRGVQTFFAPTVIFSRVRFTRSAPSGGATVGKINNPGYSLANAQTTGSQNWLKMAFISDQFGKVWQIRESWLRSGDAGWSTAIYG